METWYWGGWWGSDDDDSAGNFLLRIEVLRDDREVTQKFITSYPKRFQAASAFRDGGYDLPYHTLPYHPIPSLTLLYYGTLY